MPRAKVMEVSAEQLDADWLRRFRRAVVAWYPRHARDLPWRRTHDAYCIWISEIMLQQTTVKAVVPYYERFLARYPTVDTLATAREDDVMRHWEGLGYYSRARNLQKAARVIHAELGGRFPDSVDTLLALPGIGRYTAGAIASFAYDISAPIVEANTLRLYCRLLGYAGDPKSRDGQSRLWNFASRIVPKKSPGRFNQALMELGATVCTPTNPQCDRCPVRSCCRAFAEGTQDSIPQLAKPPEVTHVTDATVAIHKSGKWLLRKRPEGERWAGLWDFPRFELSGENNRNDVQSKSPRSRDARQRKFPSPPAGLRRAQPSGESQWASNHRLASRDLESKITNQTNLTIKLGDLVTEIVHSVTRYRIRLLCFIAEHQSGTISRSCDLKWVAPADFETFPLSVTGRKFARLLQSRSKKSNAD